MIVMDKDNKKILVIGVIAIIHAALSLAMYISPLGYVMDRFDHGSSVTIGEKLVGAISIVISLPIFYPLITSEFGKTYLSGIFAYMPLLLNSLFWAIAIYWILVKLIKGKE